MTKGWKIAAIAVFTGVAVYVGLEFLLPHHKPEVKLDGLVPAESVFDGTLQSPDTVAAAAETAAAGDASDTAADSDATDTDTTASGAPAETSDNMSADADDSADDGSAVADITQDEQADAVSSDDSTADSDAQSVAAASDSTPPEEPAAPAEPVSAPKPASKPALAKPAPPKQPTASVASNTTPTPWWESTGNSDGLHVIYVGSAAFERAIVVMGNAAFANAAGASQNIRIRNAAGQTVAGDWKLGPNNKSMLVFPVSQPGRFEVSIGADLVDAQGRKLGQSRQGSVIVP